MTSLGIINISPKLNAMEVFLTMVIVHNLGFLLDVKPVFGEGR